MAASAVKADEREKLTFRLPAEQVVTGRVVNLEGKPVAGVTIGCSLMAGKLDDGGKPVAYDDPKESKQWLPNVAPYARGQFDALHAVDASPFLTAGGHVSAKRTTWLRLNAALPFFLWALLVSADDFLYQPVADNVLFS